MSMMADLLKELMSKGGNGAGDSISKTPEETGNTSSDTGVMSPNQMMGQGQKAPADTIIDDSGSFSTNQTNPFLDALKKSRSNNDTGPGVLKQLIQSFGSNPTSVGSATSTSDQVMNPTPLPNQKQGNLAKSIPASEVPIPQSRPINVYAQPSALDPVAIDQLRQSLLTQAGQLDPGNPNGLSGRMNSPLADSDMGQQRNQAMGIEDSVRGFDGVKPAQVRKQKKG